MTKLPDRIMYHLASLPDCTPIRAASLHHLGKPAHIAPTLTMLTRRGRLLRLARGLYMRPLETRQGTRLPQPAQVVEAVGRYTGETIAPGRASAAYALGLLHTVPEQLAYLTSGPSRELRLGSKTIFMKHAPSWQLMLLDRRSGEVIRALAWAGREGIRSAMPLLKMRLSQSDLAELTARRSSLPSWISELL